MSLADELKKLAELRDAGVLTQDEFDVQKQKLLAGDPRSPTQTVAQAPIETPPAATKARETKTETEASLASPLGIGLMMVVASCFLPVFEMLSITWAGYEIPKLLESADKILSLSPTADHETPSLILVNILLWSMWGSAAFCLVKLYQGKRTGAVGSLVTTSFAIFSVLVMDTVGAIAASLNAMNPLSPPDGTAGGALADHLGLGFYFMIIGTGISATQGLLANFSKRTSSPSEVKSRHGRFPATYAAPSFGTLSAIHSPQNSEVEMFGSAFTIGRHKRNDLQLEGDELVGDRHCRIYPGSTPPVSSIFIENANSEQQTLVNGQPITQQELFDGDTVKVGSTVLRYHAPSPTFFEHLNQFAERREFAKTMPEYDQYSLIRKVGCKSWVVKSPKREIEVINTWFAGGHLFIDGKLVDSNHSHTPSTTSPWLRTVVNGKYTVEVFFLPTTFAASIEILVNGKPLKRRTATVTSPKAKASLKSMMGIGLILIAASGPPLAIAYRSATLSGLIAVGLMSCSATISLVQIHRQRFSRLIANLPFWIFLVFVLGFDGFEMMVTWLTASPPVPAGFSALLLGWGVPLLAAELIYRSTLLKAWKKALETHNA